MHQRYIYSYAMLLAASISLAVSGCKSFGSNSASIDEATLASTDDRARPWVKEVSAASYLASEEDEYIVDGDFTDKLSTKLKTAVGQGPDQQMAIGLLQKADSLFEQAAALKDKGDTSSDMSGKFSEAAELYIQAAGRWPKSSLEQDALFRAAESYFFSDQYELANDKYESLVAKYRGTRYMDVVQARRFTIANFWLDLNRKSPDNFLTYRLFTKIRPKRDTGGAALRILNKIRLDDPTGKLADDATLALANGYFERKRYLDASDTYEDLRRTFPNSEHLFDAHLFELRSRLLSYRGADYDGANLAISEKLLKTMVTQFPNQAEEHRDYLRKEAARVRMMQAERELTLAEYYDGRGEYQAAQIHYEELASNYTDTPIGEAAANRIGEISDKPAAPPQRMAWLVNLFPEAEETKPLLGPSTKDTLVR